MNDFTATILLIAALIILSPFSYIYAFIITELPKKLGYLKFILLISGYILIIAINTYLLSIGVLGLLLFFLIPNLILLIGACFFKEAIKDDLKKIIKNLRKE